MSLKLKEELRSLLQETFEGVIDQLVEQIVFTMKQHVQDMFSEEATKEPVRNTLRALPKTVSGRQPRNNPPHCIAPDCEKPHAGPRLSFLCSEHIHKYTKAEKQNLNAAWKASSAAFQNRPLPAYADDQAPPA